MNSLTTHYRRSQLIALPVPGGKAKVEYCYAVNVPGDRAIVTHSFAEWAVGGFQPAEGDSPLRQVNRWFKDHYGVPVRVIRWEPETQRVIYLREGYEHECFSPLEQFRRKFREIEVGHEH